MKPSLPFTSLNTSADYRLLDGTLKALDSDEHTLLTELFTTPGNFSLGQALRLLTLAHGHNHAESLRFLNTRVRVRPWLSLAFPSVEIEDFHFSLAEDNKTSQKNKNFQQQPKQQQQQQQPSKTAVADNPNDDRLDSDGSEQNKTSAPQNTYHITQTGFGLYSTLGPLPTFYTEELLEDLRNDESVVRDFYDLINNHLYSFHYRTQLHNKLARRIREGQDPRAAEILQALLGEAVPEPAEDTAAAYLPLLICRNRTANGLADFIARALDIDDVEIEQCVPRQVRLGENFRCRLGQQNHQLGQSLLLGDTITDITGKFRIHLHNLDEHRFAELLPSGKLYPQLLRAVSRYLDQALCFDVVLHPRPTPCAHIPLGAAQALSRYLGKAHTLPGREVVIFGDD